MKLSVAKLESEMGTMKLISTIGVPAGIKNATELQILKWKALYFLIIEYLIHYLLEFHIDNTINH